MSAPGSDRPDVIDVEAVESAMARLISAVLLAGVTLSAAVLTAGLVLLAITGRTGYAEALSPNLLAARPGSTDFPRTIGDVWLGAIALKPFAVIGLGVLVLIATPVSRVAASVVLFLIKRDYLYAAITTAVLAVLLVSILWLG